MLPRFSSTPGCKKRIVPARRVELDQVLTDRFARRGQCFGAGQGTLAANESPHANQRPAEMS